MSAAPAALRAEGLLCAHPAGADGKGFRLRIPSLEVGRGEAVALVGPSGCGKTTLLFALAGVRAPAEGAVEVDGVALVGPAARGAGPAAVRRLRLERLGIVFQELELLEHLTVLDNLLLPWHLGAKDVGREEAEARALEVAEGLGLAGVLSKRPRALSQGERQRVAVGRALVLRPRLLLADEPTGNLDAVNAARVIDALVAPVRRDGAALLCVTHDAEARARFDRVVHLEALAAEGAP